MPKLQTEISQSIREALDARCRETERSERDVVMEIFAAAFALEHGTLFQCSTAGALVAGVSDGAVTIGTLKRHGNFGLGTFEQFDGEMVALDGEYFRVRFDSSVERPPDGTLVPFACITNFEPQRLGTLAPHASLAELGAQLDRERTSENLFMAVRIDGTFDRIQTRSVCKQPEGTTLLEASEHQTVFELRAARGSMVGFWTPAYIKNINVCGWHLHFISEDRRGGGHVLECGGSAANVAWQTLDQLHLALPETVRFLRAELSDDGSGDLERAECAR